MTEAQMLSKAIAIVSSEFEHDMDPARLVDLSDKSMQRIRKYHTAYRFLLKVKN